MTGHAPPLYALGRPLDAAARIGKLQLNWKGFCLIGGNVCPTFEPGVAEPASIREIVYKNQTSVIEISSYSDW